MDWRSGSRQNSTGSAFRGISSRSRGRGRGGRGAPLNTRGGHTATHPVSPAVTPARAVLPTPPPPPPVQASPSPPINHLTPSKPPSRRGTHQPIRRTPSLSHLDTSNTPFAPSTELTTTPGGRPQVALSAFHNTTSFAIPSIPSLKLDPSTPTTPGSPRPKPPRKRSHNRPRSSSKTSTTQQISAAPSSSSLKEKSKDPHPHMASTSPLPDVQSLDLRTDIDTLVERVRAMAMAGSAVDKEKDREGIHVPHDGHIDWAGDEDDTLPDLDDWVRPKHVQQTEQNEPDKSSEKSGLPPVAESADLSSPSKDKGMQKMNSLNEPNPEENEQQAQDDNDPNRLKVANTTSDAGLGRAKPRWKHGRKKSPVPEANILPLATQASPGSEKQSSEALSPTKSRPPLVHPLPPKPQLSTLSARGFRSRGPVHTNQPVARRGDNIAGEMTLATLSREYKSVESPPTQAINSITAAENSTTTASPEPQVWKRASDPSVDWANEPRSAENSIVEPVREASEASSFRVGPYPDTHTRKHVFDPNVNWSKEPRAHNILPTRRSPTQPTCSSVPSGNISSPHNFTNPHTSLPYDRSRDPLPHHDIPLRLSSGRTSPQSHAHTRSQVNSPERSPHRWQDKEGPTHLRAHSSPQMGPGTRTHTSRPVITLDALSRISRTLGVPGATTPPRGQTVEVVVAD